MAFDWGEFGRGIAGAGQTIASVLMQDYQRKQALADQWDTFKKQRALVSEYDKQMLEEKTRIQKDLTQWQSEYQSGIQTFGSPQTVQYFMQKMQSGDPFQQMQGQALLGSITKLQKGQPLSDAEWQMVGQFDPQAQVHLSKLQQNVIKGQKDLEYRDALIQQSKAQADYLKNYRQGLKGGQVDLLKVSQEFDDTSKRITDILSDDSYRLLQKAVDDAGEEWMQKLPQGQIRQYMIYTNQLDLLYKKQTLLNSYFKNIAPELYKERPRPEAPPEAEVEEVPEAREIIDTALEKAGRKPRGALQRDIGKIYELAATRKERKGYKEEEKSIQVIRKQYKIPESTPIYTSENISRLKSEGKEGALVVWNGKLWVIGRRNKVLGLMPYVG